MSDMSNVVACLCDISKSLAVIADKLSEGNDKRACDECKHKNFPDGDGACLTCCEYYDCQYEEGV